MATTRLTSRAVVRFIEAGTSAHCAACGDPVQFRARTKAQQVICNVYVKGRWDRVEHFHRECYDKSDRPYGEADETQPLRPKPQRAA